MTIDEAAKDLQQHLRMYRRAANVVSIGTDGKRLIVYTLMEEKQPWIFAYGGYPVRWQRMSRVYHPRAGMADHISESGKYRKPTRNAG